MSELKEINALQRAIFMDYVKNGDDSLTARIRQMSLIILMSQGKESPTAKEIDEFAQSFKGEAGFAELQSLAAHATEINGMSASEDMEKNSGPSLSAVSRSV